MQHPAWQLVPRVQMREKKIDGMKKRQINLWTPGIYLGDCSRKNSTMSADAIYLSNYIDSALIINQGYQKVTQTFCVRDSENANIVTMLYCRLIHFNVVRFMHNA